MATVRTRAWGELEREILRILRSAQVPMSAHDIQHACTGRTPAHTTILSSLDRLHAKGQVVRFEESPRKVRFAAARTAAEQASASMMELLDSIEDRRAALLKFAGNLHEDDAALLRDALTTRRGSGPRPR